MHIEQYKNAIRIIYKSVGLQFILFGIFYSSLFAQEPIHFTVDNGLPSNVVYKVMEDHDGFIWIATNNGLVKYDGYEFKIFNTENGLPFNDVWELRITDNNRKYFFGRNPTLGYIQNDSIHYLPQNGLQVDPSPLFENGDNIYIHNHYGGLKATETGWENNLDYNLVNHLASIPEVISSCYNPSKSIFHQYKDDSLLIYNLVPELLGKKKLDFIPKKYIENSFFTAIDDFSFYFYMEGFLLTNWKQNDVKLYLFKDLGLPKSYTQTRVIKTNDGFQISNEQGIIFLNREAEPIKTRIVNHVNTEKYFQDSHGNLWSSSLKNGLYLTPSIEQNTQLKNKYIEQIEEFNGRIYATVRNEGLYQSSKGDFQKVNHLARNTTREFNYNYQLEKNDSLLIYASQHGANILSKNGKWKDKSFYKNPLSTHAPYQYVSPSNLQYKLSGIYIQFPLASGDPRKYIHSNVLRDISFIDDKVYVIALNGLLKLKNDTLQPIYDLSLFKNNLVEMVEWGDDKLLIATAGNGVFLFEDDQVTKIPITKNLVVNKIKVYDGNQLWIASNTGVILVELNPNDVTQSKTSEKFLKEDGLLTNIIHDILIRDSLLTVATAKGLSTINRNSKFYKRQPMPYISSFIVDSTKQGNVKIEYSAIDYFNQSNLQFEHRLLPLDTTWVSSSNRTTTYNSLKPDNYDFQLRVANQHQQPKSSINHEFSIAPKFYQSLWFKVLMVLLSINFFAALVWTIIKQVKQRERKKAEQEKRESQLGLTALRSQMNPHFVFNSLNAIQYFIEQEQKEISQDFLAKFAKLMRQFLNNSRLETIPIEEEKDFLENYLSLETIRFDGKLSYDIQIHPDINQQRNIPSLLIQPYVENAINHGIFHSENNGNVWVTFQPINEHEIVITIVDNGVGIEASKKIYKKQASKKKTNSMSMLEERIELLNKKHEWDIKVSIHDRKYENQETGTTVRLLIKQNDLKN